VQGVVSCRDRVLLIGGGEAAAPKLSHLPVGGVAAGLRRAGEFQIELSL